jgi:beta-lactamase class A
MTSNNLKRFLFTAIFGLLCLAPTTALAEEEGIVRYGVTQTVLQNEFVFGYGQNGYLPVRLTGYQEDNGSTRYFTRWVRNSQGIAWQQRSNRTLAEFNNLNGLFRDQGYVLVDVSGYQTEHGIRYAGIWHENTGGVIWTTFPDVTKDDMQTLHDTIGQRGWRPHRIEGYELSGQSRFISVWYYLPNSAYIWHSRLTEAQYQANYDTYSSQGFLPFHVHSHTQGGVVYFTGIWKFTNTRGWVRTNREVRVFQRYYNNYWASGYNIDNFYAARTPDGVRFGGIWFFDGVPDDTTLYNRVRKVVDGAPALGGAAVLNLTTGEEFSVRGNDTFTIASTSKIGILYALLKEIDLGNVAWAEFINSNTSTGSNQCSYLQPNTDYRVDKLAGFMIRCSNNWATNVLITRLGVNTINNHLADPATLDLKVTHIYRYMTGGPSLYGNANASADRAAGYENLSTPREMVKLLRKVLQDNVLSDDSEARFWETLRLDPDVYPNDKPYIAQQVTPMFNPRIDVYNKPGDLTNPAVSRHVHADAGRLTFPDGQEVLVAIFMDYISDDPDDLLQASGTAQSQAQQAIKDVAKEVAQQYYPY